MMPNRPDGLLMAFGMSAQQIVISLDRVEKEFGVELGHNNKGKSHGGSYKQFPSKLRAEARQMSSLYETFYCLENSIRELVSDIMLDAKGVDWWDSDLIDEDRIKKQADLRRKKEIDSGVTPRSDYLIDYTTFGELAQIITDNWELFATIFQSKSAVSNVTNQLNLLRGPIAHCNVTDELEWERLDLAVKTWFKIMS